MVRVGKIVATHGLQGDLVFTHIAGSSVWLKRGQALLLEIQKGSRIPYFVSHLKPVSEKEYIIHFEEVDTVEAAKRLTGKQVYTDISALPVTEEASPLSWIGLTVTDKMLGRIGEITDVFQTGHQWLASVSYNGKEILLPLVPPIVQQVDAATREIRMTLPDGILDL